VSDPTKDGVVATPRRLPLAPTSYEELQEATIASLERILFGDVRKRSRDELEARAQVYADVYEEATHARG
jgi:hypothetical protein